MGIAPEFLNLDRVCATLKDRDVRLLTEIASQLAGVLVPSSEFNPETIRYIDYSADTPSTPITYEQIAGYFQAATGRNVPVLFVTPHRVTESQRVLVNRAWIEKRIQLANSNLKQLEIIAAPSVNQELQLVRSGTNGAGTWSDQPPPMSPAGLEQLHAALAHQNDQRKASEAASKETIARRAAEERAIRAETLLTASTAEVSILNEQLGEAIREKSELRRTLAELRTQSEVMEQQLELTMALAEFTNSENPLSPSLGRLLIECWVSITSGGTVDIVADSSKGLEHHIRSYLDRTIGSNYPAVWVKQFRALLTIESRKGGGALSVTSKKRVTRSKTPSD